MIELRTLGGIDVRDSSGAPLDDLVRQPKRVAFLLYLVLAEPAGLQRRDTLLALFWPDLDAAHARAALRKSLYVLRAALGADVVISRGDDEVGIDRSRVDCDALAFAAALDAGWLDDALERYRGDLAAGFHASDLAPEWEQWLDARRIGLRRRAVEAAARHAGALADAGALDEGVRWARWACERAPDDEGGVRVLLDMLDRTGDRAGAMQVYEEFRRRLREEYDVDPAPETQELVAAIGARMPRPVAAAAAEAVPGVAAAEPRAQRSRRWGLLALPLLGAAALALVFVGRAPSAAVQPDLVAVAPFTALSLSPDLHVWQEGLVDVLARNLDGAGPLRAVSPARVFRSWRDGRAGVESATGLGRRTGAGLVVFGTLLGLAGDSLRVSATVLDRTSGRTVGEIELGGVVDRMDIVVDSLTRDLLRVMGRVRQIGSARRSGVGSRSVPALKAFLRGEQYRRRSAWDSAGILFEEAVALDSTFALAWLRLGEVYAFTRVPVPLASGAGPDSPWHLIARAGRLNHGLSLHDSIGVAVGAGLAAFVLRQVPPDSLRAEAARIYQAALEAARLYPNDAEAWYWVALVQDLLGGLLNSTVAQAHTSYSRATALDSGFAPPYRMALRVAADAGDLDATRRLAEHYLTLEATPSARAIPLVIARLLDPATSPAAAQRLIDSTSVEILWPVLIAIWLLPDSQESAVRVARAMAAREYDPRHWFTADRIVRRNLAAVLAYRGHLREALTLAGTARATWFANLFAELAVWGTVSGSQADSAFADWLAHHADTPGLPEARWWWAMRGDTAALTRLRGARGGPLDDAFLALARGDTVAALRHFAAWREAGGSAFLGLLPMVRLLADRGDLGAALAILNGREPNDWPIPSRVVWTLERARLNELVGQREAAARDYAFVVAVWRHADPELHRFVAESQSARRRLAGERVREPAGALQHLGEPRVPAVP